MTNDDQTDMRSAGAMYRMIHRPTETRSDTPQAAQPSELETQILSLVKSWNNSVYLVLPGPVDLRPQLARHLAKGLEPLQRQRKSIQSPEELDDLPIGTIIVDATEHYWFRRSNLWECLCRPDKQYFTWISVEVWDESLAEKDGLWIVALP